MSTNLQMSAGWEGSHKEGRIPVFIVCEYDDDTEEYILSINYGDKKIIETFKPRGPITECMDISDVEQSVKIVNNILKRLKNGR